MNGQKEAQEVDQPVERLLSEILMYVRPIAASALREDARRVLAVERKAALYARLDGATSQEGLEAKTQIPQQTISKYVAEFMAAGLIAGPNKYHKFPRALFTLRELGIAEPVLKSVPQGDKTAQPKAENEGIPTAP